MKFLGFTALVILAWFAYGQLNAPVAHPPGILVPHEPVQTDVTSDDIAFDSGKFHLKPLARFALNARVLHRKIYRYDRGASLVPLDLAVGWGPMSDQAVLDQMKISQSARFFWYEWPRQPPIPREEIVAHATNLHLIPSTRSIAAECESLRVRRVILCAVCSSRRVGSEIGTCAAHLFAPTRAGSV